MKIKELQQILIKKKIGFAVFLNSDLNKRDKNIFYFAGVDPEFACLVVQQKKKPFLIVAKLDFENANKYSRVKPVLLGKNLFLQLKNLLRKPKKVGIDFTKVSLAESRLFNKSFKGTGLIDINKDLIMLRSVKTKKEIEKIKKACKITDHVFSNLIKNFNFSKESEIAEFIEKEIKKRGCVLSFPTIVASGKNSSMPHYKKNTSKLSKGFCVIDFGVNYEGYCSDMTRTLHLGDPTKKDMDEYSKVLGLQEEAIRQLKEGVDFRKINKGVKKVLGKEYIHGLGHGLGINVHEPISITPKSIILKKGNVLTVEPGIYYPGKYGIRIEDDVLITKEGSEVLTKSYKELIIV